MKKEFSGNRGHLKLEVSCLAVQCPPEGHTCWCLAIAQKSNLQYFSLAFGCSHCFGEDEITYFAFFFLTENPAIFMCKCCNLFSPSQSELLSHVSEKHAEEGVNVDEIIIPLRPLSTPEPTNPGKTGDGKGAGVLGEGGTPTVCLRAMMMLICSQIL